MNLNATMFRKAFTTRLPCTREKKTQPRHLTTFRSSHLIIIKDEGTSLQLHWVEYTCYSRVGKVAFSVWAEGSLAGAVNGSCPPNPVPSSFCCQALWVNAGMEKRHFFFFFFHKPHLFYIRHSQQPQRRHFLASRKPAWTINRMCLTCSPMFFFQWRILSCFGFLILHLCEGYKNIQVLNHVSCSSERFIGLPALHFVTLTHQMKTWMNL